MASLCRTDGTPSSLRSLAGRSPRPENLKVETVGPPRSVPFGSKAPPIGRAPAALQGFEYRRRLGQGRPSSGKSERIATVLTRQEQAARSDDARMKMLSPGKGRRSIDSERAGLGNGRSCNSRPASMAGSAPIRSTERPGTRCRTIFSERSRSTMRYLTVGMHRKFHGLRPRHSKRRTARIGRRSKLDGMIAVRHNARIRANAALMLRGVALGPCFRTLSVVSRFESGWWDHRGEDRPRRDFGDRRTDFESGLQCRHH